MNDFQLTNPENPDLCDPSKSQWYTPPELAMRLVEWAIKPLGDKDLSVLEPSAGQGALANQFHRHAQVRSLLCLDIDPKNVESLRRQGHAADCADFLTWEISHGFDVAVMNPPFEGGQTEAHVLRALECCDRVVCHCPLTTLAGKDRREGLWSVAYLKRLVIHSSRPKYSGNKNGGMTDMCTIDVVRRPENRAAMNGRVASFGVELEWW